MQQRFKRRRVLARAPVAAAVIGLAALAAGCSSAPAGRPLASLPAHTGSTAPAGAPTQSQSDQDMIDFARCMRAHGVAMSDPFHRPGHPGLTIDLPPQDHATHAAYTSCNHILGPIVDAKQAGAAAQAAPNLQALTYYAECMRHHDISMLDPNPQGSLNLGNVPGITSDFGRYSPQFRAADAACRHLLPHGVHDDGTGP